MTGRSALAGIFKSTLFLAAGALGGIVADHRFSGESSASPGDSPRASRSRLDDPEKVRALGSIQPRDGVVEVALPAGALPSRFAEGIVLDGPVRKGQVIAYLEGYDARLREIGVIDAEIASAVRAIELEDDNERQALAEIDREREQALDLGKMERESFDLKIVALGDKHELCKKQLRDVEGLQLNNTIPRQQYDQLQAQEKISLEELKSARAEAERASRALAFSTSPTRIEQQKRRARLLAERARGQVSLDTLGRKRDLAVAMLESSKVLSPIDGVVLDISTKAGESGAGKPLVKLGDTSTMYVLAEIYEDERRLVEDGQEVEVGGRGLPGRGGEPIRGKVERIGSIIGAHKQSPLDPTSRDNARVFPAWIALEPAEKAQLEKLRKLVLMPVEVTIRVGEKAKAGG